MKDKERRQLLGEAVCGFVNAQTTDEAYFPILTGIQQLEKFSSSFIEEIKKVFPAMGNITPPPKKFQKERDKIRSHEDKVLSGLREKLGSHFEWRYIRPDQCFELNSKYVREGVRHNPMSFSSPFDRFLLPSEDEQILRMIEAGTLKLFASDPKLSEIVHNKSVIEDISNLQKSWTRHNTIVLHMRIRGQQERMRGILDSLVFKNSFGQEVTRRRKVDGQARTVAIDLWLEMLQNHRNFALDIYINSGELRHQPIREDDRLFKYLKIYNKMPRPIIEFDQQDSTKERYPIREEDYFENNLPLKWFDRIESDLAYCLIEFLINEDRRKLKKCPYCHHFFIADDIKRVKCYSDDCRKAHGREKKRNQRDQDPVTYS